MGKPLLIIAEDFGQTLLSTLITNKVRGSLLSCPVKSPGFGERRKEILKDMAVLTNGKVFSNEAGLKLEQAEIEHLGRADKIIVNRGSTTIVGGAGSKEEIQKRLTQIKDDIKNLTDDYSGYDAERMRERIGKLSGGIGVIRVGAPTETEMKEKKDRVEDALHATRAAVEEGIVPGGGVALLRCIPAVKDLLKDINDIGEREGIRIILNAIETPLKTIVKNAGHKPDVVLEKVLANNDNLFYGYNAATNTYEDLVESGIIDPKKVVRCALQNAASIASMLITTEAVVVDDPDEEKKIDD
jgi:chaperonin GroEL